MKKLALALSFILVISLLLTACSAPTLIGKWKGELDLSQMLNEQLAATDDGTFAGLQFKDIKVPITMEFTEDGTCTLALVEAYADTLFSKVIDQMMPILQENLSVLGLDMESFYALTQTTEEEFTQMLAEQLTDYLDLSELNVSTKYQTEDGVLYIGDDLSSACPYTLKGHQLTIEAGTNSAMDFLFPLVLTRA